MEFPSVTDSVTPLVLHCRMEVAAHIYQGGGGVDAVDMGGTGGWGQVDSDGGAAYSGTNGGGSALYTGGASVLYMGNGGVREYQRQLSPLSTIHSKSPPTSNDSLEHAYSSGVDSPPSQSAADLSTGATAALYTPTCESHDTVHTHM